MNMGKKENSNEGEVCAPAVCIAVDKAWQLERPKWSQQNRHLLRSHRSTDCILVAGSQPSETKRFACHKLLLGKASPVFAAMLYGDLPATGDIAVTDVQPDTFEVLLQYLYTGAVDLSQPEHLVFELGQAADKYLIASLKTHVLDYLLENLQPRNACQIYDFAKLHECNSLKQHAQLVILNRTDEVVGAKSFAEVSQDVLMYMTQQDELHLHSEVQLISSCFAWARHEAQRWELTSDAAGLCTALGPVLQNLRFLTLTLQEFAQGPATSDVLSAEEKVALTISISNLGGKNPFASLPQGFSSNVNKRIFLAVRAVPSFTFSRNINGNIIGTCPYCCTMLTACVSPIDSCSVCFVVDNNVAMEGIVVPAGVTKWNVIVIDKMDYFLDTGKIFEQHVGTDMHIKFERALSITRNDTVRVVISVSAHVGCTQVAAAFQQPPNTCSGGQTDCSVVRNPNVSLIKGILFTKIQEV